MARIIKDQKRVLQSRIHKLNRLASERSIWMMAWYNVRRYIEPVEVYENMFQSSHFLDYT
jgi:hypothetical protein